MRFCGDGAELVGQRGARRCRPRQMIGQCGIAAEDHAHGETPEVATNITVIASEAKQSTAEQAVWIASSQVLLAMTARKKAGIAPGLGLFVCRHAPRKRGIQ